MIWLLSRGWIGAGTLEQPDELIAGTGAMIDCSAMQSSATYRSAFAVGLSWGWEKAILADT
jgi:hypothetical protein